MNNPSAAINNQRHKRTQTQSLWLSQWLGLCPGQLVEWSIRTFLGFLVIALPPYTMALHYYYSSDGNLLSSAVAGSFGTLLTWEPLRNRIVPGALGVTFGLLALCCAVYLMMPTQLNLLFALVVTSVFAICLTLRNPKFSIKGGRSELILTLSPFSNVKVAAILKRSLLLWAMLSLLSHIFYKFTQMHWVAFIPMMAIAVSFSTVQNSWVDKEHS